MGVCRRLGETSSSQEHLTAFLVVGWVAIVHCNHRAVRSASREGFDVKCNQNMISFQSVFARLLATTLLMCNKLLSGL